MNSPPNRARTLKIRDKNECHEICCVINICNLSNVPCFLLLFVVSEAFQF